MSRQNSLRCDHTLLHGATYGELHVQPVWIDILSSNEICKDWHVYCACLDHFAEQEPQFRVLPCCLHGEYRCENPPKLTED